MADFRIQQQRLQNAETAGRQSGSQKKKKSGGGAWLGLVIAIMLFNGLSSAVEDGDPALLGVIAVIVVAVLLIVVVKAVVKAKKQQTDRPVSRTSAGRVSAAVQRRDPRTRSFTQPEAYCVVCDHSGEDHFQRDKARRIAQLDDWLKNGLIDRAEYQVLKTRYENDL